MKGAKALLASWLLVCAAAIANADVTATIAGIDPLSLTTAADDGRRHNREPRQLTDAELGGPQGIGHLGVRQQSTLLGDAATADCDEL